MCSDRSWRQLLSQLVWWSGIGATAASVAYFATAIYVDELMAGFSNEGRPAIAYWVELSWPWPVAGALGGALAGAASWFVRSRSSRRQIS